MPIPFIVLGSYVLGALGAYGAMSYFQDSENEKKTSENLEKVEKALKSVLPTDDLVKQVSSEKLEDLMKWFNSKN